MVDRADIRDVPVFDPVAAYPEIGRLRGAVAARDWPEVSGFLLRQQDDHDRSFLISYVTESAGVETFLETMTHRSTTSLAHVLLANRYITLAWDARTSKRAKYVSGEQFATMHNYLRKAERILIDVTANEPGNVLAWEARLTTARGLELGQSEARRRYDRLAAHNPHHFPAQQRLLQQLCPKWSGSWDAMHGFARDCLRGAPRGGYQGVLAAQGHLEHWLELTGAERAAYLRQPRVFQEIVEAAQSSVLHPSFRPRYGWVSAHGEFALIFGLAGEHTRAAVHFRALRGFAAERPWSYLGDKTEMFVKYRDLALAAAGRQS
jgi:hypothetical protein